MLLSKGKLSQNCAFDFINCTLRYSTVKLPEKLATPNKSQVFSGKKEYIEVLTDMEKSIKNEAFLSSLKKGTSGRSSFSGMVVTVFGATGHFGRCLVNQLGKIGSQVIVPYRGDSYDARHLKLCGDLGQVLFMPYHIENETSLRKAIQHSNVVINLIGRFHETRYSPHELVQVTTPRRIARLAREYGVSKFVQMSHLNADVRAEAKILNDASYLKTKALGEEAVLEEFPSAIIIRPSEMYGGRDHFFYYLTNTNRRYKRGTKVFFPLYKKGLETVKQPVFQMDVARAIVKAILDPDVHSQIFQFTGPNRYRLADLIRWMLLHLRWESHQVVISNIDPIFKLRTMLSQTFRLHYPPVTLSRLELESHTDVIKSNLPNLIDLGVTPTRLEDRIAWEVKPYRIKGFYLDPYGEYPDPPLPPLVLDQ